MLRKEKNDTSRVAVALLFRFISAILIAPVAIHSSASLASNSNSVSCAYTPHLSCSDSQTKETLWDNTRYSDPDTFAIGLSQLFISHSTTSSSYGIQTGKLLWQVSSDSDAQYFYPVISGKNVYLARSDGVLEKRQAGSGDLIWSKSLADGWVYPPLIHQNQIITGGQNRTIWVLDSQTGETRDTITLKQELVAPLFQAGEVFVASTFDGQLSAYTFNQKTAKAQSVWITKLDAPAFSYLSDSRNLLIADMGGTLSSFNSLTGHLQWQKTVHQNALFWNVLYQHSLISLTESGSLIILDIDSGKLQQQMQFERRYVQAPIVRGDELALYDINGAVQHLTPEILHRHPAPPALTSTQRGI